MDDEAKERRRRLNAARMREKRAKEKELRKDEPRKSRGGQPTDNPHRGRHIYLTDEEWAYCKTQTGGASEFMRQLVTDHREFHENGTLPRWLRKDAAEDEGQVQS